MVLFGLQDAELQVVGHEVVELLVEVPAICVVLLQTLDGAHELLHIFLGGVSICVVGVLNIQFENLISHFKHLIFIRHMLGKCLLEIF